MPTEDVFDPSGSPGSTKQKRGCLGKAFLVLGIISAVCMVLCCGAGALVVNKIQNALKEEPEDVKAVLQKIADVDVPEDLPPAGALDLDFFGLFNMQLVAYGNQVQIQQRQDGQAEGEFKGEFLLIFQMKIVGVDDAEMERQLQQQSGDMGAEIRIDSRETQTVTIDGEEREFEFAQGTNVKDNSQVRVVRGAFRGRSNPAYLMLVVPEESWSEDGWNDERAIQLLESIHR